MNVTIACSGATAFRPGDLKGMLGGSETAVIEMARELTRLGHSVTVANGVGQPESHGGVEYVPYSWVSDCELLVIWRSPEAVMEMRAVKRDRTWLWLHDTVSRADLTPYALLYDRILTLSEFHRGLYAGVPGTFSVTRNGTSVEKGKTRGKRDPNRLLYASNLDRGLVLLLEGWVRLKLANPDLRLTVSYSWDTLRRVAESQGKAAVGHFEVFKDYVESLLDQDGVEWTGGVGKEELHRLMSECSVLAYPCIYPEVSCIAAMEAQDLGCVPCVMGSGALPETVTDGVVLPVPCGRNAWLDALQALVRDPERQESLRESGMSRDRSWASVAAEWGGMMEA